MGKFFNFFAEVKGELAKVVWPSRKDTLKYTVTVILFSVVMAAVLGAFDYGLLRVFEAIINR
ncbi:MAG TPA: preprotein translocase subunit SecE [Patescibacteria group bacterium]|nr:preprotein translocase subunit SecE [Patescibacteria group bacterium]